MLDELCVDTETGGEGVAMIYCSQLSLSVSPLESLHPPLFVVHLGVDVGQLPLESLHAGPGVVNVRLEEVRIILGTGS